MNRTAWAVIDLKALCHNLQQARQAAPQQKVMVVIKANAYGHGLIEIAKALSDADALAVASSGEAIALRGAGIDQPIVVLQGPQCEQDFAVFASHRLQAVLHQQWQADYLVQHDEIALSVWLKIDSGMGRMGFQALAAQHVYDQLSAAPNIAKPIGLMTHMACADDRADDYTRQQLTTYQTITQNMQGVRSIANSAAILGWPQTHADWIRPGIMLYGSSPFIDKMDMPWVLKPVMTLKTRLIAICQHKTGDHIGYGCSYTCQKPMRIGIAAIGYGDGYPRHAPTGTPVLVAGQRTQLVGRVSMDMLTLDITDIKEAAVGSEVILWGQGLAAEEVATYAQTISYELFCAISCERIYTY